MHVRAIALALPLLLGIACSTTQKRSTRSAGTAAVQTGQTNSNETTSEPRTAQESATGTSGADTGTAGSAASGLPSSNETTSEPRTAGEATTSPGEPETSSSSAATRSGLPSSNETTSEPRTAQESPASPTSPTDTETRSSTGAGDASSSASSGSTASRDPIIEQGDPVKGHAEDHVVSGKIARVSRRMVVIQSDAGERSSLFLVPETTIEVDGQDAHRSDLKQGQEVRASFDEVNGRNIAVKIRAGQGADKAPSPDDPSYQGPSHEPNQGSSGSFDTGGSRSTGSTPDTGSSGSAHPHQ
jgi:hypothetical protein